MAKAEETTKEFEKLGFWAFEGSGAVNVRPAPSDKAGEIKFDMQIPFNWDGTPNIPEIKKMLGLLAMCLPQHEPICGTAFGGHVYAWELAYTLGSEK